MKGQAIGNHKFEEVENFKYLGTIVNKNGDKSIERKHRIQLGNSTYYRYKNRNIRYKLKII